MANPEQETWMGRRTVKGRVSRVESSTGWWGSNGVIARQADDEVSAIEGIAILGSQLSK